MPNLIKLKKKYTQARHSKRTSYRVRTGNCNGILKRKKAEILSGIH